ncbi:MAG: thiamine pyrophosphate-dependent enzyme [Candidatus Eisenbacteria bacterium]
MGKQEALDPPQTSTIASHLPKAVGCAIAIARSKRIGRELPVPRDAIVVCSFGDASTNHSTALGAFNVAAWTAYQNLPVPILFVCEDNGIGISTRSPSGYLEREYLSHPGIKYFRADGLHMREAYRDVSDAVSYCREKRVPVFLHLKVVRLLGHAGSDFELEYRSIEEIEATEAQDPVLARRASVSKPV